MRLRTLTLAERPGALAALRRIQRAVWPATMAYINEDAVCRRLWPRLLRDFAEFQLVLCDARGRGAAGGYTIPFAWAGRASTLPTGVDGVLVRGVRDHRRHRRPTALCALLAVVHPRLQGRGLSRDVIVAMGEVRDPTASAPSWRRCDPRSSTGTRFTRMARWQRADGPHRSRARPRPLRRAQRLDAAPGVRSREALSAPPLTAPA